jgi:hypothetical protein
MNRCSSQATDEQVPSRAGVHTQTRAQTEPLLPANTALQFAAVDGMLRTRVTTAPPPGSLSASCWTGLEALGQTVTLDTGAAASARGPSAARWVVHACAPSRARLCACDALCAACCRGRVLESRRRGSEIDTGRGRVGSAWWAVRVKSSVSRC